MNKIIGKFLLTGDQFISELHLKQPIFIYTACKPIIVVVDNRVKIQNFRETGYLKHLYRSQLDKSCFAHNGAYSDSTD